MHRPAFDHLQHEGPIIGIQIIEPCGNCSRLIVRHRRAFTQQFRHGHIEIKSAAYLQSWGQKDLSSITFKVAPSCAWDRKTQARSKTPERHSDFYVFCLLKHKDKETLDPKNLDQWEFFVLPTSKINEKLGNQENLSLSRLEKLEPTRCRFGEINGAVAASMKAENAEAPGSQRN